MEKFDIVNYPFIKQYNILLIALSGCCSAYANLKVDCILIDNNNLQEIEA